MKRFRIIRVLIAIIGIAFLLASAISHIHIRFHVPGKSLSECGSLYDIAFNDITGTSVENARRVLEINVYSNEYELSGKARQSKTAEMIVRLMCFPMFLLVISTVIAAFIAKVKKKTVGLLSILGGGLIVLIELLLLLVFMTSLNSFYKALNELCIDGWLITEDVFSARVNMGCFVCLLLGLAMAALGFATVVMKVDTVNDAVDSIKRNGLNGIKQDFAKAVSTIKTAKIIGISGMYQGASFDVSNGQPIKMGRDASSCNIVFDQYTAMISRVHCIITYNCTSNNYLVQDISKNGVFVGNMANRMQPNSTTTIQRGTVIYLGSEQNSFRLD